MNTLVLGGVGAMSSRFLTPEEVAERLQISRITVLNHLRSGTLKGTKVGKLWRVSEEALADFCYLPPPEGVTHVSDAASGHARTETSGICRDSSPATAYRIGESERDELDTRWLDANWDKALPPYEWGPGGIPAMKPVRYIPGKGLIIEGEKPREPK